MYVAVRQWCCKLELFVKIVGIILTTNYLLLALAAVGWYIFSHNIIRKDGSALNSVREVSNYPDLNESNDACGEDPDVVELGKSEIVLAVILMCSFIGVVTNLFLVVGVKLEKGFFLLPWLVFHCIIILICLGGGVYLGLHFAILGKCEEYAKTGIAMFPIVFGIFFIFIWIMVDHLFVKLRNKKHIKDVIAFSRTASLASFRSNDPRHGISSKIQYDNNTLRSNKSVKSLPSGPNMGRNQPRERAYQIKELSCELDIPGIKKSRSLDHILDCDNRSPSVGAPVGPNYWTTDGRRTLRRKLENNRKTGEQDMGTCKDKVRPKKKSKNGQKMKKSGSLDRILDSQSSISSGSNEGSSRHMQKNTPRYPSRKEGSGTVPRRAKEKKPTDTLRSTKSVASIKNVTIHPEVTEYHYREVSHDREFPQLNHQFDDYDPHSYDDNFDDLVEGEYCYDDQYDLNMAVYNYNDSRKEDPSYRLNEKVRKFRDNGYRSEGVLDEYEEYSSSDGSSFNNYDVQSARLVNKPKRISVIFEEDEKMSEFDENKNWVKEETRHKVEERIPSPVYPTETPPLRNRDWKTLSGRQFTLTKTNQQQQQQLTLVNDYEEKNYLPTV